MIVPFEELAALRHNLRDKRIVLGSGRKQKLRLTTDIIAHIQKS